MKRSTGYRLPLSVVPIHYDLQLQPDLEAFTFTGSERVTVEITRPVSSVTLHALDLKVTEAAVRSPFGTNPVEATRITTNRKRETVTVAFGKRLEPGKAEILLRFEGELNDKMNGFYRTSYEVRGAKRWGAATQFEATDARRAFPCWDEPDRKATFAATLTVPEHLSVLSNMPIRSETKTAAGTKTVTFKPTPRMSTYLLAWVVAELDCLEATDRRGVPIRVWTTPGKREQGRFALEAACHTLPYFADWFGIPYAFPKLDMVALPDFAFGAMENWGLITYRETALLVDPHDSSEAARQN